MKTLNPAPAPARHADFRLSAKDFYSVVDTIGGNYAGLYAVLVAGWDIGRYCAAHKIQKRHMLARIEKVRAFLETGKTRAKPVTS